MHPPEASKREARSADELRADIQLGLDQLARGESTVVDESGLRAMFDEVKRKGRVRLAAEQKRRG